MGQTVYADLLFLINFSMDFLCFYITAKLLHRKLACRRALLASVAGGVYGVAAVFSGFVPVLAILCDAGAAVVMCVAVFAERQTKFRRLLLCTLVYIGVSAALGGFMTAIFNLLNRLELPLDALADSGDGMPVWLFALIAAVSGIATLAGGRFFRSVQSQKTAEIEIVYGGRRVKLCGVCDTGNMIRDPICGKCVVAADLNSIKELLPEQIVRAVRKNDSSHIAELPQESARKLRLIPAHTAAGSGMLYALTPDSISVRAPGGEAHAVDALFAPAPLGGAAKGYQALFPPELLV